MENLMIALHKNNLLKNANLRISGIGWELGSIRFLERGEILYKKGDKSRSVFLIIKGRVQLTKWSNNAEPQVMIFSNHDFFGAKELFTKIDRCSEAVTVTDSFLIELSDNEIKYLVELDDNIAYNIQKGSYDFEYEKDEKELLRKRYACNSEPIDY